MTDQKKYDNIKATATYKSGREEVITGKLKKDQLPYAEFSKKLKALKSFPTVDNVAIEKY